MSYAVRNDGLGWRAVGGPQDVGPDETYSAEEPAPILPAPPTKAQRIAEKLQAGGFPTKGHLYYFIENMRTVASLKLGITDAQAHAAGYAGNPMYKQMVDLYNDITDIEAEP